MSTMFSEASRLLINNLEVVKEIRKAEGELNAQLRDYLLSMEGRLKQCEWWDADWHFNRWTDSQVYITRSEWKRGDDHAIYIGIEGFNIESLFGTESFATLYVWVPENKNNLVSSLRSILADESHLIGSVETKGNSKYIVTQSLRKCLPSELDQFDKLISKPIIDYFSCYAKQAQSFSTVLMTL